MMNRQKRGVCGCCITIGSYPVRKEWMCSIVKPVFEDMTHSHKWQ